MELVYQQSGLKQLFVVSSGLRTAGKNMSGSARHARFPLFNQSLHLKRISLFWDFNPVSELISETQGLEQETGRGIRATQLHPCSHNYTHQASRHPTNHALKMHLGKLIFFRRGNRSCRSDGSVGFQAFFGQIRTRMGMSVNDGQATVEMCLTTTSTVMFDL